MAKFEYIAKNQSGNRVRGMVSADSKMLANERILQQGLTVISLKEKGKSINLNFQISQPKVKLKDKVVFTRQLSTMISAGVPLTRSLQTLSRQTNSKGLQQQLPIIIKSLEEGRPFAEALDKFPKTFDSVFVNMVRSGEAGGILDEIFERLAIQMEKDAEIRGKLKSALTYPGVVMTITVVAFIYLMTTVVPKINNVVTQLGGKDYVPPIYTRVLIAISDVLVNHGVVMAIVTAVGGFAATRFFTSTKGRPIFDTMILKIPVLGPAITKVSIARFARTFSSLSAAGVSVLEALKVTGMASGNKIIEKHLLDTAAEVKSGKPLSLPLSKIKLFPPILAQMVAVGEETGQIDVVLEKLAGFYEREVDELADSLSSIIEPLLIVVLGGVVGVIALSVFGPLSNLTQTLAA